MDFSAQFDDLQERVVEAKSAARTRKLDPKTAASEAIDARSYADERAKRAASR